MFLSRVPSLFPSVLGALAVFRHSLNGVDLFSRFYTKFLFTATLLFKVNLNQNCKLIYHSNANFYTHRIQAYERLLHLQKDAIELQEYITESKMFLSKHKIETNLSRTELQEIFEKYEVSRANHHFTVRDRFIRLRDSFGSNPMAKL